MKEIIRIVTSKGGKKISSARELHAYMDVSERFSRWIDRMFGYGFIEGVDYTPYQTVHPQNKQVQFDYHLTISCAKEIAMLQRTEKGKEVRQYFIEVERIAKRAYDEVKSKPISAAELMLEQAKIIVAFEKKQQEHEQRLQEQEEATLLQEKEIEDIKAVLTTQAAYITILGYALKNKIKGVSRTLGASLGRKCSKICKEKDYSVGKAPCVRWGEVNTYPIEVVKQIFEEHFKPQPS